MNKTYDTIYSKDSKGNIRVWFMEQSDSRYRTTAGLLDGERVTSEWSHAECKNAGKSNGTSAIEQATAEIEAKYKKQLKTGYHQNMEHVDLIQYVEPMLAEKYKEQQKKVNFAEQNWGMQCKFNGNRCVATKEGLFTRKGEKYVSVPHIENALDPFFVQYPDAVLDGELFNNDLRQQLNEITKIIRKTKHIEASDFAKSEQLVKFYIYDGYNFSTGKAGFLGADSDYSKRKNWIDNNVIPISAYLVGVGTELVKSEDHMNKLFQKLLSDQQEGGILRRMDAPYEHKRSKSLLKVKSEDDDDGIIQNITDGDGNWKGAATNVTLKWKDKTFDAVFKGSYETRVEILKSKTDWIGKKVTFLYMGLTGLGTPQYARIDPSNCFSVDR